MVLDQLVCEAANPEKIKRLLKAPPFVRFGAHTHAKSVSTWQVVWFESLVAA
jgi:hypothetical protein